MRSMLLFFLIFFSSLVNANPVLATIGDAVLFQWGIPNAREDNSVLLISDIRSYKFKFECSNGYSGLIEGILPNQPYVEYRDSILRGRCRFSVAVIDLYGQSSKWAPEIEVIYRLPKPTSGGFRDG